LSYDTQYFAICYQRLEKPLVSISGQSNTLNMKEAHRSENTAKNTNKHSVMLHSKTPWELHIAKVIIPLNKTSKMFVYHIKAISPYASENTGFFNLNAQSASTVQGNNFCLRTGRICDTHKHTLWAKWGAF